MAIDPGAVEKIKQALVTIQGKMDVMKELAAGVATDQLGGLIIRGEPGIGKTYELMQLLTSYAENPDYDVDVIRNTGHITPLKFFYALGDHRAPGCISVFDDCDTVYTDQGCCNVLKAALDTDKKRHVAWNSSARGMNYTEYDFHGGVIILTNAKLTSVHYQALLDRVHYYDMRVTKEEKLAKIWYLATQADLGAQNRELSFEVCCFLIENESLIEELSVRTFVKMIELAKFSLKWKELAIATLFKEKSNG